MNPYSGYRDFDCYKKRRASAMFVVGVTKRFPQDDIFLLAAQIKRSVSSITANIAAGYGRFTYNGSKNIFITARASVTKPLAYLPTAFGRNYMGCKALTAGEATHENTFRTSDGGIVYLDKSKKPGLPPSAPIPNYKFHTKCNNSSTFSST